MKDNFSVHAGKYAKFRPQYPEALFDHLLGLVPSRGAAWDCGTGNGQVASKLALHFAKFNVSFQKVKAAVYTLGHDLKDIEAWLLARRQKMSAGYSQGQGFSRSRSSV